MPQSVIEARHLDKSFLDKASGKTIHALRDISCGLSPGRLNALVGPDGAGKTTFMRLITGLLAPDRGTLTVLGLDTSRDAQGVQDRISYMPQKFGLYEDLSVQENLDLYADLHNVPGAVRAKRFARLLEMTDLASFTARPAGKLSGGMKQKLGLACTLVRSPDLLLLDEPTVGVDPLSRRELWAILHRLVRDERLSVLVSTAYMDEAAQCGSVFIMHEGRFLAEGTPDELCAMSAGRCFSALPPKGSLARTLQAHLLDDTARVVDAVPQGGRVRLVLEEGTRPEDVPCLHGVAAHPEQPLVEDTFMLLLRQAHRAAAPSMEKDNPPASAEACRTLPEYSASAGENMAVSPGPDKETVIEVRDLVRRFGSFTAVANTSFSVARGEIFGLLGPNGAGKTTTFRMLCGLLPASSGYLRVAGENLRVAQAKARAKIGYVSQKFALYGNLSALENLEFFGGVYGLRGASLSRRINAVLGEFNLRGREHMPSGQLPGGYKQRLAMAAALLHEPEILFLDEPTSGIDPLARRAFWRRITNLAAGGTTVVVTTHFMEEAEYCDRMVIQDAGKLLAIGAPHDIRTAAGDAATMNEAFIRIVEKARAHVSGETA